MSGTGEDPAKQVTVRSNEGNVEGSHKSKEGGNRLPKGYGFQSFEKPLLRKLCQTSLFVSSAVAISNWILLAGCMFAGYLLSTHLGWAWSTAIHFLVLWPLCSRSLRGFENLTHEGSHYNFDRKSKKRNDRFVDWLCAFWILISVEMFRMPHEAHHKYFGSDDDPDKKRFDRLGVDDMPRKSSRELFVYLLRALPIYVFDYWKQFSNSKKQLKKSLALHILFMGLMSWMVYENFWLLWLAYFWVPFVLYLPVLRFLAEAEEHQYKEAESEFSSTFSNLSGLQRWFLHPHGDAYHLLHHMLPQVPHWKMAWAHWLLATLDTTFQSGRFRNSIFGAPQHYLKASSKYIPTLKGASRESTLHSRTF